MRGFIASVFAALVLAAGGGVDARLRCPAVRGEPLPYDAEVEWLENPGVAGNYCRLHLDYHNSPLTVLKFGWEWSANRTNQNRIFGDSDSPRLDMYINGGGSMSYSASNGGNWIIMSYSPPTGYQEYLFDVPRRQIKIGAKSWQMEGSVTVTSTRQICIFGAAAEPYSGRGRLYWMQLFNGDELKVDLIPVRKDGVGYYYDRVNKRLYANDANGTFVIGPDKN